MLVFTLSNVWSVVKYMWMKNPKIFKNKFMNAKRV